MFHRLRCAQGVLKSCYLESDLELYPGSSSSNDALKVKGWKDEKLISLHEASKRQNPCNKFYGDNCSCQKGCSSRRCGCVIKVKPCTSHCHGRRPYQNEVEHITPGRSSSNSTIEGKDEAKLMSPGSAPSNSTKKMKQNLLHVLWRLTVQIENIAHAKRTAHPVIVVVF